jgi:alpha-tubulin suppressor-like RCC1 family protein
LLLTDGTLAASALTSTDAQTWNEVTPEPFGAAGATSIARGAASWLAVTAPQVRQATALDASKFFVSTDGTEWSETSSIDGAVTAVAAAPAAGMSEPTETVTSIAGATTSTAPAGASGRAIAVAVGLGYGCALLDSGAVKCWGSNEAGQLGTDRSGFQEPAPVPVAGLSDATAIAAGQETTCAVHEGGTVSCWGENTTGLLGTGTNRPAHENKPKLVPGLTGVESVAIGFDHACAVHTDGTVSCWGRGRDGALGNGTKSAAISKPVVVPGLRDVTEVSAGQRFSCALLNTGEVRCWGLNLIGQIGIPWERGQRSLSTTPVSVTGLTDAKRIASSKNNTCAVLASGRVTCWGSPNGGALGNASQDPTPTPVTADAVESAADVAAGGIYTCAVIGQPGAVTCWGADLTAITVDKAEYSPPTAVPGLEAVVSIDANWNLACAARADGTVACWGRNDHGQLGAGTDEKFSRAPVAVKGL